MRDTYRISLRLIFTKTWRNYTCSLINISLASWDYDLLPLIQSPLPCTDSLYDKQDGIGSYTCNLFWMQPHAESERKRVLSVAVSPASGMSSPLRFVTVNTKWYFSKIRPRKSSFTYTFFFPVFLSYLRASLQTTVMRSLVTGIHSEKCFLRRFHFCVNFAECTYTN